MNEPLLVAEELVARGDILDAVDFLQAIDDPDRDPAVDCRLAELRRDAFTELDRHPSPPWPPQYEDPFPGETDLIELTANEATPDVVGGAVQHHGCALLRGVLDQPTVERLIGDIDAAFEGLIAANEGRPVEATSPWYVPLASHPDFPPDQVDERANLRWYRVCTMDSPRAMFDVIAAYEAAGIGDLVRSYLGGRPVLTASKWALRRMPKRKLSGWHQEASVFPPGPWRTLNVWLTLTACGDDAPGLDVVPRREREVYPVEGGFMMTAGQFAKVAADAPIASPRYQPGDAMVFDQYLIHKTNTQHTMESQRHSIESWFFAPSDHPVELGPIVY